MHSSAPPLVSGCERLTSQYKTYIQCEYEQLAAVARTAPICPSATLACNVEKNRYKDVLPLEHTRVKLNVKPCEGSDYINANYVANGKYICCQAPLETTRGDFWRMVWDQNSGVIVMLCNLMEKKRVKCWKYWPDFPNDILQYGSMFVRLTQVLELKGAYVRSFQIQPVGDKGEPRKIVQIHYTEWPDFGVPQATKPIRDLIALFEKFIKNSELTGAKGPPVIHCSAGIGRTGTFIGIHLAIQQVRRSNSCTIKKIVETLRSHRRGMVQTLEQYAFIYQTLKDALCEALPGPSTTQEKSPTSEKLDAYLYYLLLSGRALSDLSKTAFVGQERPLTRSV